MNVELLVAVAEDALLLLCESNDVLDLFDFFAKPMLDWVSGKYRTAILPFLILGKS